MKAYLEYITEVTTEIDPVNTILSVAELVRSQAEHSGKVAKLNMLSFLTMLRNAGLNIDFEGLKSYYEDEPNLKNKIQQFNDREIVFVAQGNEVDSETLGQPQGNIPPEEKVEKMAKRAMKAREGIDEAYPEYEVKYAKSKKGPIQVTKFMTLDQAKKFLANIEKDGMKGIISKDGKPVREEVEEKGMVIKVTEENAMNEEYKSELTSMLDLAGVDSDKITEKNPDGTISADEEENAESLYASFSAELDDLIGKARQGADEIGGQFRSPGIDRKLRDIMRDAIDDWINDWTAQRRGDLQMDPHT